MARWPRVTGALAPDVARWSRHIDADLVTSRTVVAAKALSSLMMPVAALA